MEIALAPFGVARLGGGLQAGRQRALIQGIDIVDIEDDASPPRPPLLLALGDEVEITASGPIAGKGCGFAAIEDVETERGVEADGAPHVVGGERDGANAF